MGWATEYIERLESGETAQFRPVGRSMTGLIESGQLVTVVPITDDIKLGVGDIVLCTVRHDKDKSFANKAHQFLHLIKQVRAPFYLIGNNKGHTNGWSCEIHGKCVKVEP